MKLYAMQALADLLRGASEEFSKEDDRETMVSALDIVLKVIQDTQEPASDLCYICDSRRGEHP